MKKSYVLVNVKKYNNSKGVLFVMESDDFRLEKFKENYEIIASGVFEKGNRKWIGDDYYIYKYRFFYCDNGQKYKVFRDQSAVKHQ